MSTHCQLHTDGAGFFAQWCSFDVEADQLRDYRPPLSSPLAENDRRVILVTTAEQLFDKMVVGLSTIARHALDHCGANGDAVVAASLLPIGRVEATVAGSAHILNNMNLGLRQTPGTHELQQAVVSHHTLPLRSMHTPSPEMMVAVRLLMTDLLSLFGQAGRWADFRRRLHRVRKISVRSDTPANLRLGAQVGDPNGVTLASSAETRRGSFTCRLQSAMSTPK